MVDCTNNPLDRYKGSNASWDAVRHQRAGKQGSVAKAIVHDISASGANKVYTLKAGDTALDLVNAMKSMDQALANKQTHDLINLIGCGDKSELVKLKEFRAGTQIDVNALLAQLKGSGQSPPPAAVPPGATTSAVPVERSGQSVVPPSTPVPAQPFVPSRAQGDGPGGTVQTGVPAGRGPGPATGRSQAGPAGQGNGQGVSDAERERLAGSGMGTTVKTVVITGLVVGGIYSAMKGRLGPATPKTSTAVAGAEAETATTANSGGAMARFRGMLPRWLGGQTPQTVVTETADDLANAVKLAPNAPSAGTAPAGTPAVTPPKLVDLDPKIQITPPAPGFKYMRDAQTNELHVVRDMNVPNPAQVNVKLPEGQVWKPITDNTGRVTGYEMAPNPNIPNPANVQANIPPGMKWQRTADGTGHEIVPDPTYVAPTPVPVAAPAPAQPQAQGITGPARGLQTRQVQFDEANTRLKALRAQQRTGTLSQAEQQEMRTLQGRVHYLRAQINNAPR